MLPGAYLFLPDRGGEPLIAIVRPQKRALFFALDGTQGGDWHRSIWIPIGIAYEFGRFLPLVAHISVDALAAPLRRAAERRVPIRRLQPAVNGSHFQPHPPAYASAARVEGKNGADRIDRERNAGGLR